MTPFFSPTRSFPSDALVTIMIPIGVLFLVSLELTLSDTNQNGLKHQTYTNCFKGSPGTQTLKFKRQLNFLATPDKKG